MILNANSPVPLYRQLADLLLQRIRSGEYPAGSRIPSEHELAKVFGIGRPTVRQATDLLVRKGLLERRRGSGTYVMQRPREVNLFSLAGTTSAFHEQGIPVAKRIVEPLGLVAVAPHEEQPFAGKRAYFMSRLTVVEETPVLLEDIFLDPELFPGMDAVDMGEASLAAIVEERYYMKPEGGRQTFRIGYLRDRRARLLGVSGTTAILVVQRFLRFARRESGIYSELYCRTERFVFSQIIGDFAHG